MGCAPEPFLQTGYGPRTTVVGVDLLNLVTYITAWPDATLDEMAAFIYNKGGDLYSRQAISNCLQDLDVTRKKASTEGYQTQRPDVEFRVWGFWNCPPPLGVLGVPRWKLLDFDEFGVSLEKCNRTGGVGCEGNACPKGWTLPPRGKDNSHLCDRAGGVKINRSVFKY